MVLWRWLVILLHYPHPTLQLSSHFFAKWILFPILLLKGGPFCLVLYRKWLISKTEENSLLHCLPTEDMKWTRRNPKLLNDVNTHLNILSIGNLAPWGSNLEELIEHRWKKLYPGLNSYTGQGLGKGSGVALACPTGLEAWRLTFQRDVGPLRKRGLLPGTFRTD